MSKIEPVHQVQPTVENYYQELDAISAAGYFRGQIMWLISSKKDNPEEILMLCRMYQMAINALLKDFTPKNEDEREYMKVCMAEETKFRKIMASTVERIRNNQEPL